MITRKILAHILVITMTLLPLTSVLSMSMPMDMSMAVSMPEAGNHCAEAMMNHDGHAMPPDSQAIDKQDKQVAGCQCCGQCDGDCMGCSSMTAITIELAQISAVASRSDYSAEVISFNTRNLSPPSPPPLSL